MSFFDKLFGKGKQPSHGQLRTALREEKAKLGSANSELKRMVGSGSVVIEIRRPQTIGK